MDKIAVLIPCYCEEQTIGKVVRDFKTYLPESVVYVYDNNSTDNTAQIAKDAGATVRHEHLQGKGNVIRRMFAEIEAECYLMVDGDDTYPAAEARKLIDEVIHNQADMAIGDRLSSTYFKENKRPFHNFGNSIVRSSINLLFKSDIQDIMTGYRAFSYRFVKTFAVLSRGFEIETEMTIHAVDKNMQIANVIIDYKDRPEGSVSKLNTVSDGMRVLRTILRLFQTYRPLLFFGIVALVLSVLALTFIVPIIIEYMATGLVPRFPTLFVCGFVMLAAIQSLFSGFILQTIYQKNRQDFELELYKVEARRRRLTKESSDNL